MGRFFGQNILDYKNFAIFYLFNAKIKTMNSNFTGDIEKQNMNPLVKNTQKALTEWKTRSKRKRFRCQNVQGRILALCP